MDRLVGKYMARLRDVRRDMLALAAETTDAELNFTPDDRFNAIAGLLRHLAGAERYWFGEVLGGEPAHRDRNTEFLPGPLERDAVVGALEGARTLTERVMEGLTDAALDEVITCRSGAGREIQVTRDWIITHHIEHEYQHYGQMLLLRKLARLA